MVKFGTGGWRAEIARDFTEENIRLVAQGLAQYAIREGKADKPIVVGRDRRFLSDKAAVWISETLAANGLNVLFIARSAPTPLVMHTVMKQELHFGVEVTASHNPSEYNGIKVIVDEGRDAPLEVTDELEKIMLNAQKEAYGDGLDPEYRHPYMWCCKSHYYSAGLSYYNFPYAFGGLFSRGLYAKYLEEGMEIPAVVVAPQCPNGLIWNLLTFELKEFIDSIAEEYRCDKAKISITGLSMGGYGTWEMLMSFPGYFYRAAPVCGGGVSWRTDLIGKVPVWAFHGDRDVCVPPVNSYEMCDRLKAAGGLVKLTVFHGVDHESWEGAYEESRVIDFLIGKFTPKF